MASKRPLFSIVLSGPSSIGKTTVANEWCRIHKEYVHIQEVARDVMKREGLTQNDLKKSLNTTDKRLFIKLQEDILIEQNLRESAICGQPFISDRGLDPLVYVQQQVSPQSSEIQRLLSISSTQECIQRYRHCLIVILCPLNVLTDDDVRLVPADQKEQNEFIELLTKLLDKHQIPFVCINEKDHTQRMKYLENAVFKHTFPFDPRSMNQLRLSILCPIEQSSNLSATVCIPTIQVTTNTVSLSSTNFTEKSNRMIDRYGCQNFALITFHHYVTPLTVRNIFNKGVLINGIEYQFLGCSSSGLKQRKCYLYKGDTATVETILTECGSFLSIKSVSKQLKRIAQLFSAAIPTGVEISKKCLRIEEDIENKAGNFTDGCGMISEGVASKLMSGYYKETSIEGCGPLPSVFQIRYEGCKGIVMKDPSLPDGTMMVRKSMKKFNPGSKPFNTVWLCDFSKPYSFGHINKQFIILFSALGIKDEVFLEKQIQHFESIKHMTEDPEIAIKMLGRKHPELAISLVQDFRNIHNPTIQKELKLLRNKCVEKLDKLRILIPESRNIFGVCDPLGVLKYGECFVRPTIRGHPHTLSGSVTVSKNPCYLLGDVRVFKAVSDDRTKGLEHLIDCIVFPIQGKRPHPAEIAGSDLDGDMYFVCWDSSLIVPRIKEPYDYPSTEAPVTSCNVSRIEKIDFISRQNKESMIMGKIDRYFNYWASIKGADCEECISLGKLFSRSVDASKTGDSVPIASRLKPPDEQQLQYNSYSPVWKEMESRAATMKEEIITQNFLQDESILLVSESFMWNLVQEYTCNFSEFELFLMVHRWCLAHDEWTNEEATEKLIEFSSSINFGKFSIEEQKVAIDVGVPIHLVTNALNKSNIFPTDALHYFSIDSSKQEWRQYFYCQSSDFNWQHLLKALGQNSESLLIFRLPDGVIIVLHILKSLQIGISDLFEGSIIAYFFSKSFNFKIRLILGSEYSIHLTNEILQIYRENDKRKTFIWLKNESESKDRGKKGAKKDLRFQVEKRKGEKFLESSTLFDRLSVDLSMFKKDIYKVDLHSKINKQEFLEIEVLVKKEASDHTYFDIFIADQTDVVFPEIATSTENIEEVPLPEIPNFLSQDLELSGDVSTEELLKQMAEKGNCTLFLSAVNKVSLDDKIQLHLVRDCFLIILTKIHVMNGHLLINNDTEETLLKILTCLSQLFVIPRDCVVLLEKIFLLNLTPKFIEKVRSLIVLQIEMTQFSSYFEVVSLWRKWCVIPFSIAVEMAKSLNVLCQSVITLNQQDNPRQSDGRKYFCHFVHRMLLYFLEDIHGQINPHQELNNKIIMLKISPNPIVSDKCIKLNFHRNDNLHCGSEFTIGTYVFVSPMKPSFFPVTIGRITSITKTPPDIVVECENPIPEVLLKSSEFHQGHWELRLIGNVTLFNRCLKALKKLIEADTTPDLLQILIDPKTFPPFETVNVDLQEKNVFHNSDLKVSPLSSYNDSQQKAIHAALTQKLTLIHGPPGTGKTHVACGIIEQIIHINSKILVTAETNMAVDNLTRRLCDKNINVIRIGNLSQISPDIRHVSLDHQIEEKRLENSRDKKRGPFPETKFIREVIQNVKVVATTCVGAGDPILEKFEFPFVLIDEATLVIEPVSLIPILLKCKQLVLVGDPQQLSPQLPGHSENEINDLSITIFHRFHNILLSCFLNEQHRMHPALAEFPSKMFYNNKLNTAPCLRVGEPFCEPIDRPSVFLNVSDQQEKRSGTSYCNHSEVSLLNKVIKSLINNQVSPFEITILTPYIGQVQCIKESPIIDKIQISTIDRFQGQENEVIVFSTVRCNHHGWLGFTADEYRMNVLLTRAKRCLIGVGSVDTLQKGSKLWEEWLKQTKIITESDFKKYEKPTPKPLGHVKPQYVRGHQQKQYHYKHYKHGNDI